MHHVKDEQVVEPWQRPVSKLSFGELHLVEWQQSRFEGRVTDIGKVWEPAIGEGLPRLGPLLEPHPRSCEVVKRACERIARFGADLTADLLAPAVHDRLDEPRPRPGAGRPQAVSESLRSEFPDDRRPARPPAEPSGCRIAPLEH